MSFHAKQQSQRRGAVFPARASPGLEEPPSPCQPWQRLPGTRCEWVNGWRLLSVRTGSAWLAWGEGPSPLPRRGSQGQQALGPDPFCSSFLLRRPVSQRGQVPLPWNGSSCPQLSMDMAWMSCSTLCASRCRRACSSCSSAPMSSSLYLLT